MMDFPLAMKSMKSRLGRSKQTDAPGGKKSAVKMFITERFDGCHGAERGG
jgi:hypothetical protein